MPLSGSVQTYNFSLRPSLKEDQSQSACSNHIVESALIVGSVALILIGTMAIHGLLFSTSIFYNVGQDLGEIGAALCLSTGALLLLIEIVIICRNPKKMKEGSSKDVSDDGPNKSPHGSLRELPVVIQVTLDSHPRKLSMPNCLQHMRPAQDRRNSLPLF